MANLIAPGKNLGHSNLYLDFLSGSKSVRDFYPAGDLDQVARRLESGIYLREKLYQILRNQNQSFGAGQKALANIEKIKVQNSVVVFSGQQAVLFGGPLLIMIKALTLVKTAIEFSQKLNRPVVPIFWIAGDDHDFEEANHTLVLNKQSEEVTVAYNARPEFELPASEIRLSNSAELNRAKSQFNEALGESEFTPRLFDLINSAYQPGETLVAAFGRLMAGLTTDFGLVFFNPGDATVKRHAVEFFEQLVKNQEAIHEITSATNQKILKSGYHLQVQKSEDSTHLFYNSNGRKPVLQDGDKFKVADKTVTPSELLKLIEDSPESFSPDVLTRPVFQSYLFPVLCQRGGPAEIAYLAQSSPFFELFALTPPVYLSRPSATFVEKHLEKMMYEYEINFEDLTGDIEQVINRVLTESFPANLENDFEKLKRNVANEFDLVKDESLKFDSSLKEFAEQTFGKIDFAIKNLEAKVFASHKKKSHEARNRIYRLWHALFPAKALQERSLNVGYFISKYGFNFIGFMYDRIDINEKSHQLISLSEFKSR